VSVPVADVTITPLSSVSSGDRPTITGTGEPGYHIAVTDNTGAQVCQADVKADGTWSCVAASRMGAGQHQLTATQTDPAGNPTAPAQTGFAVPAATPAITHVTTGGGKTVVTGTGEPGWHVSVTDTNTTPVCSADIDTDGNWSCTVPTPLGSGQHVLTVVQTDPGGGSASAPVVATITVGQNVATGGLALPLQKSALPGAVALVLLAGALLVGVAVTRRRTEAA
jgi:hypothetical protein